MEELFAAIQAWPVIVQGALGSALFAFAVFAGQRITKKVSEHYSRKSSELRVSWLVSAKCKYSASLAKNDIEYSQNVVTLIYRSSRHLFKALIWLALGLSFQTFYDLGGLIGYLGCLFYLFKGYEVVGPIGEHVDDAAELAKIDAELAKLGKT